MLGHVKPSGFGFTYDNWGTNPSATPGTSVVPGASNAEGAWTQIASSANIAHDIYDMQLSVYGAAVAANNKSQLMDIGVDPAGGTSYTAIISNIIMGQSYGITGIAWQFRFPFYIKAGSSVAVRVQGSNATAGTVRVCAVFAGQLHAPHLLPVGQFSETIGTITNSGGQSFTPGNAADGAWQSLGTTAKAMWWWQLGYQISNATVTAERVFINLAVGDGSNKHIILRGMHSGTASEQNGAFLPVNAGHCYWHVPAGGTLYVRGRCENAPDTGYNAVAIGIGG